MINEYYDNDNEEIKEAPDSITSIVGHVKPSIKQSIPSSNQSLKGIDSNIIMTIGKYEPGKFESQNNELFKRKIPNDIPIKIPLQNGLVKQNLLEEKNKDAECCIDGNLFLKELSDFATSVTDLKNLLIR